MNEFERALTAFRDLVEGLDDGARQRAFESAAASLQHVMALGGYGKSSTILVCPRCHGSVTVTLS